MWGKLLSSGNGHLSKLSFQSKMLQSTQSSSMDSSVLKWYPWLCYSEEIIFHRAIFYSGMWGLLVSYLLQCIFPLHKLKYFRKSLSKQLQKKKKNLLLRNFAIYRRLRLKFLCDSTGTATCQTTVINGSTLLGYQDGF